LAEIADTVYAIQECNTVFPGAVDDFFRRSPIMQEYFSRVIAAEQEVFGNIRFSPPNVRSLSVKGGDVSNLDLNILRDALEADVITVFGSGALGGRSYRPACDQRSYGRISLLSGQLL
jgi:hypothetical protein